MAKIVKCTACGGDVATSAKACPKCGAPPPAKEGARKRIVVLASIAVLLPLGIVIAAPADLEVSCNVGGPLAGGSSCTFTNPGQVLPGQRCVRVIITKHSNPTPDNEYEAAAMADSLKFPEGSQARSSQVCSGRLWGGNTKKVEIGHFDTNPALMCGSFSNCSLDIEGATSN